MGCSTTEPRRRGHLRHKLGGQDWRIPQRVSPQRREGGVVARRNEERERNEEPVRNDSLEALSVVALSERIEAIKLTLPGHLWAVARLNPGGGAILDIT